MSDTVETAPLAVPRDRSVEARHAKRQAKASRERRIIASLNRGVPVAVIAEWEDVGEKRMRTLVRDILARRMPESPTQFLATQVSRLNEGLLVPFDAMSGSNLQAVDRVVKIVRELDRYHGFVAAERWGLPDASEAPEEIPRWFEARIAARIRPRMAPQRLEKIESAPGNGMAPDAPDPQDMVSGAAAPRRFSPRTKLLARSRPPPASPETEPQKLEKIESAPGTGISPEGSSPQDLAPAREPTQPPQSRAASDG
jgi:hypothetical protein